ncbi:type VII secretion protein EccE [Streptomyces sp. TRM43335]|uniref:Type VII secretion protein EccE n=1 Tax=Streptomyces taklimakanensis TaxID=2569853 RepID=A0A6G2BGE3_9ACTN|nr:type VII secretion protein EccE [Streptomyces taklimakanensis]MTE21274.1 type VII secretion protein EccE [Streptomyces taklimakanensis]
MGTATRARTATSAPDLPAPDGARPESARPRPTRAVTPRVEARHRGLGPLRLHQLVMVELAAAGVLAAAAVHEVLVVPTAVVAVLVLLAVVSRRRGRPLPEWLGTVVALRRRRRRAAAEVLPPETDPGLAPAVECEPALRSLTYTDRDRRGVGMVGDGTFLTAVLRVEPRPSALRSGPAERPLPLRLLSDVLEVDGIRLESVQAVQYTQPAPAPHLPARSPAASSYGPLQAACGAPAVRVTWVALKLDPELCREAIRARGDGLEGAQRCLVRAADQLASRLVGAGFRATLLSEQELVTALATSAGASPMATTRAGRPDSAPARRTEEKARAWRCDDRWHTTYAVARWPELGPGAASLPSLVATVTGLPALATTFSLTLSPGERRSVALRGHVRITARSDGDLVSARHVLERLSREHRIGLVRLDREQVPGVLATLPLGGTR